LKAEGFQNPLLFRTNAQFWVDRAADREGVKGWVTNGAKETDGQAAGGEAGQSAAPQPPEGGQYKELTHWLGMGLGRLEIEAVKARGVSQLLSQLQKTLEPACPPDLSEVAARTRVCWSRLLGDEAAANAAILLNTLEPYRREIEHHFALERQGRF